MKVHEKVVTAQLRGTVKLSCTVEASPLSVNFWVKKGNSPREIGERGSVFIGDKIRPRIIVQVKSIMK